jgi:hypothetical protein
MKAKRQIESTLNSVTMLDGSGGHVTWRFIRDHGNAKLPAKTTEQPALFLFFFSPIQT